MVWINRGRYKMKKITDSELLELPFGSKIRVIWHNSKHYPKNDEYYGGNSEYYGIDKNARDMVVEACQMVEGKVNFKDYD